MLVSLTVGKVDAGVTVLLTPDKRLIEFPSILLPPDISSGSIVDITVGQNTSKEDTAQRNFRALQDQIYNAFGAAEPSHPNIRCRNATQTSVVLEWDPIELATADIISLSLYRNGQKAGNIPRPLQMHSTKISGLAVDTEYTFHLVLRTSAGAYSSEKLTVRTHKMTDLRGITITTGIMPASVRENLTKAVERIGAKIVEGVRIDTTHFVTTEGRGQTWEKAVEMNIPVVRPEWVDACEKNGRILGVTKFYLDAMRPGPYSEEQSVPSPPIHQPIPEASSQATLPVPEQNGASTRDNPNDKPPPTPRKDHEEEDSDEEQEEKEEPEQKSRPDAEQKVRFEDQEEQKVALHSKPTAEDKKDVEADKESEDSERESEDKEDEATGKPATTPDGSSFQEVEL